MADAVKAPAAATAQGLRVTDQRDSSIDPEHNVIIINAQASLISHITAHIAAGDKAASKAEQHYIAAGQYLTKLKATHAGSWAEWEVMLKAKVHISTGRASELMQIADGRTTVAKLRIADAQKHKRLRRASGRPEEKAKPEPGNGTKPPLKPKQCSRDQRELEAVQAHAAELEAARDHDGELAEQLQAAKIRITGLESEIAELKQENAELRAQLEAAKAKPIDATAPKKGGRPKGSKNKPKSRVVSTTVNVATPGPDLGNDPGPFPEILRRDRVQS